MTLTYEDAGPLAVITLDDGKANVLSPAMQSAIHEILDRAEADAKVVVLAGRPGRFSGGFDLAVMAGGGAEAVEMVMGGFDLSRRILGFPRPVVIACTGHAVAMGAFLLASGDVRIGVAGGGHRIQANEVAIGLTLPRAAIEVCRGVLSPAALRRVLDLAWPLDHDDAMAAGFLDEVVPEGEVMARAREVGEQLAGLDAAAHLGTKLRTRADLLAALDAAIAADRSELGALLASA